LNEDDKDSGDDLDDDVSNQDEDDDDFITPLDNIDEVILFTENFTRKSFLSLLFLSLSFC
jgi:hypothetical protein